MQNSDIKYVPVIQNIPAVTAYHTDVLRLDLLHPEISGNKWFKLKKNLDAATAQNKNTILTFGGAFSNHIAATASVCKLMGLKSIGVIRGIENQTLNPTLLKAQEDGMVLHFVSRAEYDLKDDPSFKNKLAKQFGDPYIIPEGGNNEEGVFGCMEILKPEWNYDYVFCACGTATTYAGILASAKAGTKVIGISVLKGKNVLVDDAKRLLNDLFPEQQISLGGNEVLDTAKIEANCITNNYCFNGYAKFNEELIDFKKHFEETYAIPLDYIYTNKLFYAVWDLIKQKKLIERSKILIIHSGGLQGNKGFEERYTLNA